jgi:putative acetyltransferase
MNLQLRDSKRGDEAKVLDLVRVVLGDYALETNPAVTDKDLSDIQSEYFDRGGLFRVLEADGQLIGSYGLYRISGTICELRKMYLLSEYQGQGHGRAMMDDALVQAKRLGFREMILETNSVLSKARKLYEQYGFEPYEPEHLSDRCDAAMKRRL